MPMPLPRAAHIIVSALLACTAGTAMGGDSPAQLETNCPSPERPAVLNHWRGELQPVGQGEVAAAQSIRIHIPVACAGTELQLTIEWENPADDLDVDLLDPIGRLTARADRLNPLEGDSQEQIRIATPYSGHYVAALRNYAAVPIPYRGQATLRCRRTSGCTPLHRAPVQTPPQPLRPDQLMAGLGSAGFAAAP